MSIAINFFSTAKAPKEMQKANKAGRPMLSIMDIAGILLIAMFLMVLGVVSASAQQVAYSRTSGDWNNDNTWLLSQHGKIVTSRNSKIVKGTGTQFDKSIIGKVLSNDADISIGIVAEVIDANTLKLANKANVDNTVAIAFSIRKVPAANDHVNISYGDTVTVSANACCQSLTINGDEEGEDDSNTVLTVNNGDSLYVAGDILASLAESGIGNSILNINGYMSCANMVMIADNGSRYAKVSCNISNTGYVAVDGDLKFVSTNKDFAVLDFTGTGTFSLSGNIETGGTINYYTCCNSNVIYYGSNSTELKTISQKLAVK